MIYVKPEEWQPSPGITVEGKALDIVTTEASVSVLAGPGAGKTELLAQRAMYLLTTGLCPPPRRILAIALKVDAARNLEERVTERCDPTQARRFESLTLAAFSKKLVDQFLESLPEQWRPSPDYKIVFTNRDVWEEFRNRHSEACPTVRQIRDKPLDQIVHRSVPEFELAEADTPSQRIQWLWWRGQLDAVPSRLTFDMVMALATYILRSQDSILAALRHTYPYVFLDEFQDVTDRQYDLIKAAFLGSDAVLTAVGDTDQAIMGWAGAPPDIFDRFEADFHAPHERLLFNYRSNARIVALINDLAATFSGDYVPTECARKVAPVPDNAVEGWVFETRQAEGEFVAAYIEEELQQNENLCPEDFVILARLRVNDVENRILPAFRDRGLKIRNEARSVGEIAIQDLMKEKVFSFVLACLKLTTNVRGGQPFQDCRDTIADVRGADVNSDRGHSETLNAVRRLVNELGQRIKGRNPTAVSGAEITALILDHVGRIELQRTYKEYSGGDRLNSAIEGFEAFFDECRGGITSWSECIANMEGSGAVRLMTIHKSKGLEYHTVIFVEFNDDAFWGSADDVNVFFVALSRARERVFFSFSKDSRGFSNVQGLLKKLSASNVAYNQK